MKTLADWLKIYGEKATNIRGCKVVPLFSGSKHFELYNLSDFRVSSVVAGSVYLIPVNCNKEINA